MIGFTTWPAKDIVFLIGLILAFVFNVGGFVWVTKNHFKHVNDSLKDIIKSIGEVKKEVATLAQRVSKIEGFLDKE